jgi:hypothetical protein
MREVFIHDVVTLGFLIPFSFLSLAEVFFHYTIYPLFLTHAIIFHMLFDLAWIHFQPRILTSFHSLIKLHHLVVLSLLVYPLFRPFDARLTAISGLIEFDTSLLLLRRIFRKSHILNRLYTTSNLLLRVYYVTLLTIVYWQYFKYEEFWVRLHIMSGQMFINLFSYAICILTYTKEFKRKLN